jgi:O-antigen/teichoic acid export membrane protein
VSQTATSAILGLERHRDYNLASLAPPAANLALLLVLVVALDLGLPGAVIAAGAGSVAGMAAAVALFLRATPRNDGPAWPGLVGEALRYGWRAHLANLAWFLHYRADMFLVGYMAGPAALGFYSVAVGLAEKLYMAPSAVGTVLFPRVAATAAAGAPDDVTDRACRHTLWLTLGLALILAAVGRPVIDLLYGADFLPSALPMWLLLPGVVSLALGRVVSADLNGRGRPGTVARANAGLAVANVALNLWWIPIWGAAGAAAATSVSYGAAALLLAWLYRRLSGSRWSDLLVYRRSDWSEFKGALVSLGGPGAREGTR